MLNVIEVLRDSPRGQEIMPQIYDLRRETYDKIGWTPYSKEKSKLIKDEFDESSNTTHFAIIEDGQVIGSHRATKYTEEEKMPLFASGQDLSLFKTTNRSISELSRLVVKQDKKYPGCVLQLVHNVMKYTLDNTSELVCSIGNSSHIGLFKYLGTMSINDEIGFIIDKEGEKMLVINGIPVLTDKSTLNQNLPLDKYEMDRTLVIVKESKENISWDDFWTDFSKQAYDYTNLLPENKKMLNKIASLVGRNKKVLDAGCGTGNLIKLIAENNELIAMDLNKSMLSIAMKKTKNFSNVSFKKGSVTELPFENDSFDVITSINVIYHLDEPEKVIKEARRVLKENGKLIISSPLKGIALDDEFIKKVIKDCQEGKVDMEKFNKLRGYNNIIFDKGGFKFTPSMQEISDLLKSNGFEIIIKERIYYDMNFLICARKTKEQNS